ncbi:tRNA (adenosine(37)-N6)-threonylcarbamoyltransferase complex dimerization subunit type 1 TsaB [uncultured Sphingomonas sp.]|uniref:tRNA (adenosine(37)-N6)-threonylcarbamoyltransferase complex dimerization subunit type 1 TsaB n=1 Tax=uncultured Sphingomonas sp. TaxID=158754 RepID=UPI00262D7960|nr:tRNA (adenosine(37)-N6)-threonylcarbamoyltransferase complex dimerization subunit type 1 TsaB [uncultured Sphingomonas sp.]
MRTLVIETATAACSVALIEDGRVIDRAHDVVGRGHAEKLVPMIAALAQGGRADRILVDCGPGSFTGIRVGLAAALGLGFGWQVPVTGYQSLALVAAAALAAHDLPEVCVVLEGGHGEVFLQPFAADLSALAPAASLKPDIALTMLEGRTAVGTGVHRLTALAPDLPVIEALPDAAEAHRLPAALADLPPRPIYGRAPDAKPPAPRAAIGVAA